MKRLFILVVTPVVFVVSTAHAEVLAGPFTNAANSHHYFLLSSNTASRAEAEAISLGGHLVTINDAAEQQWVFSKFGPLAGSHRMWIGLFQLPGSPEPAGGWVWMSGDPSTYRNWNTYSGNPEPDNDTAGGKQQNNACTYPINDPVGRAGSWSDRDGTLEAGNAGGVYGIAEVTPYVKLSIYTLTNMVYVSWATETSNTYQLQWSSSIPTSVWNSLGGPIQGTGVTNLFSEQIRYGSSFYRLLRFRP